MVQWPSVIEINTYNWFGWWFLSIFTVNFGNSGRWNFFTSFCKALSSKMLPTKANCFNPRNTTCLDHNVLSRWNGGGVRQLQQKNYDNFSCFFLAEPTCPLGEIDAQARWRPGRVPKALQQFSGVYYMIKCHFGPPWGHLGTHGGPQMAQNSIKMA